jgi:pre-mRNA-splicing factor SYF1
MEILSDKEMINMGIRYANLERKLGEIDRSRAIYAHIS